MNVERGGEVARDDEEILGARGGGVEGDVGAGHLDEAEVEIHGRDGDLHAGGRAVGGRSVPKTRSSTRPVALALKLEPAESGANTTASAWNPNPPRVVEATLPSALNAIAKLLRRIAGFLALMRPPPRLR